MDVVDLEKLKALLSACLDENCKVPGDFGRAAGNLFDECSVETIAMLVAELESARQAGAEFASLAERRREEIERLKKFEEWFARLETATTAIDESFRDERDLALFSVFWAARLYMVPSEVTESGDEEFCEKIIRSGAETLMVGGRRLRDAAEKDEKGKPVIPFDWQYRSARELAK